MIREFKDCDPTTQQHICSLLYQRWEKEYKECDLSSAYELQQHLSKEIFKCFVLFDDQSKNEFLGTVSSNTDTGNKITFKTNFFICNLFVKPDKRKMGYGKILLDHIEKYLASQNISTVTLYCEQEVYDFYIKHKYNDFGKCPGKDHLTCMMKFLL